MVEGIEWLGHDSFRIRGSKVVYVDPWKLAPGAPPADVILVTHDHHDHFSKQDITDISTPATVVVGPAAVTEQLGGETITVRVGDSVVANGVQVTAVHAYNVNKYASPGRLCHDRSPGNVGYIFELDGRRIYHAGDTDSIPEMADIDVDVALLPVSGTYVMTAGEAAEACHVMKAKVVIPMHYGDVAGSEEDAVRLSRICRYPVEILEKSE